MSWGDKPKKDIEDYSVGPVEDLIICKEIVKQVMMMTMINQMGLTQKLVICITLVTESDVTSSMMGEMHRQLASAQLRGRLYKTEYRRLYIQRLLLEKYKGELLDRVLL